MKRGAFTTALATSAGAAFATRATAAAAQLPRTIRKPPRLVKGDKVGLVALAGPLRHAEDLEYAKQLATTLGVRLVVGEHLRDQDGYLAGRDEVRANDFNRFARDPTVRAIFSLRGGYGTMRLLDRIDYGALIADPKIVIGFSDLTALLNTIVARTGVVTFHGPVAGHHLTGRAVAGIRSALMSADPLGVLRAPSIGTLSGGKARGRLVGGNLSIVAALSGTPYAVACAGNILLLEDVREAPYRVDRMLTQLMLSGDLTSVAGIALGSFRDCIPRESDDQPSWTIDETLRDRLGAVKKPMITRLPAGHIEDQWTLPLGMVVSFDGNAGTMMIADAAVQ